MQRRRSMVDAPTRVTAQRASRLPARPVRPARSLLYGPDLGPGPRAGTVVRPRGAALAVATVVVPVPVSDEELSLDELIAVDPVDLRPLDAPTPIAPPARRRPAPAERTAVQRFLSSVVTAVPALHALVTTLRPADRAAARSQAGTGARAATARAPLPATRIDEPTFRELRSLPILDGIPDRALEEAWSAGELALLRARRDDLLDVSTHALLLKEGQVALARFATRTLEQERDAQAEAVARLADAPEKGAKKAEKQEQKRRQECGPMAARALRNLSFFDEGDLIDLKLGAPGIESYACYAVTPATAVLVSRRRLDAWRRAWPFLGDRLRRASQAARQRIDAVVGAREEVADFFVRHGLSVAQTLRVRQIDKCVECGACESACEERYGVKRLALHLPGRAIPEGTATKLLGGLDFVDACHTCTDQRCIDPCAFDAIRYDRERREVVIVEAACTGCTLCASACPYHAIEMHDLDAAPSLAERLAREGALAFGAGTPRKAKLRRMASKCDHCVSYEDQACISACPTGALFEVAPADVFHARPEEARRAASAGFDHSVVLDTRALLDPKGLRGIDHAIDRARAKRPRIWTAWMWATGLLAWAACAGEIALRKLAPELSLEFAWLRIVDGLDADLALSRVDFRPGCLLAVRLGYLGSAVMFAGMLYPARKRIAALRNVGSQRAWFEVHVMSGVIGPLFVLLHSAAKLDNWVSIAFWSMVGTVASGLLGRYLTTQLPERASTAALDALEADRTLASLRARHAAVRGADEWLSRYQRQVAAAARRPAPAILAWMLSDDLSRALGRRRLRAALRPIADSALRAEALSLGSRLAIYERRRALLPRLGPLFGRWKLVHVPMAITLTLVGGLHIVLALLS